jgi:N-acetylmuramoyl-L-alanine amidase
MKSKIFLFLILFLSITFLYQSRDYINPKISKASDTLAAAFFSTGIEVKDLISRYASRSRNEKIKILIVAGHEPNFGGAEYGILKERDLNLQFAEVLKNNLVKNTKFEIIMARDNNGWNPEFEKYVRGNTVDILAWSYDMKKEMSSLVKQGKISAVNAKMGHSTAPTSSMIFLYGINKWASLNKIDIAIHIHFNDNPKRKGKPNYEGFSIYVPEKQYSNSASSKVLAVDLMEEISKVQKVSTLPEESIGVIEDQELIALGSYNTSDSLSVLVEYAYIYENLMQNKLTRDIFINKTAEATAKAVENFFESRLLAYRK